MENITAVVDSKLLQEKANEFAMKGALKALEDYYTGYSSPFKEAITKELSDKGIECNSFKLPDIVALINDHLSAEVDKIANTAVAKTFIPMVSNLLCRQKKHINFSDILTKFIGLHEYDNPEYDDFHVSIDEHERWKWLSIEISSLKCSYSFTLHEHKTDDGKKAYVLLSLPRFEGKTDKYSMKLTVDNATLEIPFTKDVLKDEFVTYLAGCVLSGSIVTMDVTDFDDSMFPERCHCH